MSTVIVFQFRKKSLPKLNEELWQEFREVTVTPKSENQALRGFLLDEAGQIFRDNQRQSVHRNFLRNRHQQGRQFFRQALNTCKERFQQKTILILSWVVDKDYRIKAGVTSRPLLHSTFHISRFWS